MNQPRSQHAIRLLQREFEEIKLRNSSFSLRAFAKRLGISSGALSEMISGQRQMTLKQRLKILDRLNLSPEEREQFLSEDISPHLAPKDKKYHLLSDDQFRMIADWWHFALLNLINTKDFNIRLPWLSKRLGLNQELVKESWQRLLRLGYIVKTKDGKIKRSTPSFNTTNDIVSLSLRKAHIQDLNLIEQSLMELPVELRSTSSITAPIKVKDLAKAKKLIDEFQDKFMDILESSDGDEVYRLSVSFFPLTQPEKGK